MEFPKELKYSKDHEWLNIDGDIAYIGITDFGSEVTIDRKFHQFSSIRGHNTNLRWNLLNSIIEFT